LRSVLPSIYVHGCSDVRKKVGNLLGSIPINQLHFWHGQIFASQDKYTSRLLLWYEVHVQKHKKQGKIVTVTFFIFMG
jgi:hypothetical protein